MNFPPMLLDQVLHCAAQELLSALPDESVDLIVTDPPYGKGYKAGHSVTNGKQQRRASRAFGKDIAETDWLVDAYRILKPDSALYLCTQWDVLHLWYPALESAGFKVAACIIWDKELWGQGNLSVYGCQTEFILFAMKGKHIVFSPSKRKREGNIWKKTKLDAINNDGNFDNPTQKPEWLMSRAIMFSSKPGDIVLDPFCGSGTTGAAARKADRRYLMCDSNEYQYFMARGRLQRPYTMPMVKLLS